MDDEELLALGLIPAGAGPSTGEPPPVEGLVPVDAPRRAQRVLDLGTMDVHTGELTGAPAIDPSEEIAAADDKPPTPLKRRPEWVPVEQAEQMRDEGAEIVGRDPVSGMARVVPHEARIAEARMRGEQISTTRPEDFDVVEVPQAVRTMINAAVPLTGGLAGPALSAVMGGDVAPRTISPRGVALGAGEALTLGNMAEIGEAIGGPRAGRIARETEDVAQAVDPGGVGVGSALGTLPWLIAPGAGEVAAARGVGTTGRIAATALEGSAIGAAAEHGAGGDTAGGALGGAAFGAGLAGMGTAIGRRAISGAEDAAIDAERHRRAGELNALSSQIQAAPGRAPKRYMDQLARLADRSDDIVGELRDAGVRSPQHAEVIQARAGEALGQIAERVDAAADRSFNAGRVGDRLRELAQTIRSRPGGISQRAADALDAEAAQWVGSTGFADAWESRRQLNNPAIWRDNEGYLGPAKEHSRALYRIISDEMEAAIGGVDPGLVDAWRNHSRVYSITSPIVRGAGEAAVRSAKNKGLLWVLGAMGGASILGGGEFDAQRAGSAATAVAVGALAHKVPALRARYHTIAAALARSRPEALGRFAGALQTAASRGPRAVAAAHFALWQREPEYRRTLREQAGEETEQ